MLHVEVVHSADLVVVVDLDQVESERLPIPSFIKIAGNPIRQLRRVENPAFPAMLLQYLEAGAFVE
jgi:HPr kinase/phosphorylase